MIKRLLIVFAVLMAIVGWLVGGIFINEGFWGFIAKTWPIWIVIFVTGFVLIREIVAEVVGWIKHGDDWGVAGSGKRRTALK